MAGDRVNPSDVWGPNQNYADRVGLAPAIGIPMESDGNTFDRGQYQDVQATKTSLDKNSTQAKPLGQIHP
jgi:hypothetical protein